MPSPIGHALAGLAIAWGTEAYADAETRPAGKLPVSRLALTCAALAVAPDLDLLYLPIHRTATHSVAAAVFTTIVAAAVTGRVTGRVRWPIAFACGSAYASHILLDWLGADVSVPYGIQAWWPFSGRWFISRWTIFPGTERRSLFSVRSIWINAKAAAVEIGLMVPIAYACWQIRASRRHRQAPQAAGKAGR
jgi:inner membrane protein